MSALFRDAQSRPVKVSYNGVLYTYAHNNLQGDIVGLLDSNGSLVVEYKYDAWGKLLNTTGTLAGTLGKRNPFRYRGYVYDAETGLYYLRSRYYNPAMYRFLNADIFVVKAGYGPTNSVFCYYFNNSISYTDANGRTEKSILDNISDFFERICEIIGSKIEYDEFGDGEWKYSSVTVVKSNTTIDDVVTQIWGLGNAAISGFVTTALISSPVIGMVVGAGQYVSSELASLFAALTVPDIPDGVYTLETASYTEKESGPFGIDFLGYTYNKTYYYIHGYDTSGCDYYAIWSESYTVGFGIMGASSWVLSQRTQ